MYTINFCYGGGHFFWLSVNSRIRKISVLAVKTLVRTGEPICPSRWFENTLMFDHSLLKSGSIITVVNSLVKARNPVMMFLISVDVYPIPMQQIEGKTFLRLHKV